MRTRSQVAPNKSEPPMSSPPSQLSQPASGSGSNKRKASDMGPPEGPPEKKAKRPTPLETKLIKVQKTIATVGPIWKSYDPGLFMEEIHHMRQQFDGLAPDGIAEFIASGDSDGVLSSLNVLDHYLQQAMNSKTSDHQKMLHDMLDFVGRIRESLKGQS